jgi:hypothetical protein
MENLIRYAIAEHMIEERLTSYESNRYTREFISDALLSGYTGYKDYSLVEIASEYFDWHSGEDDENPLHLDWDVIWFANSASGEHCTACGRPSMDCSQNPCAAVIADREE